MWPSVQNAFVPFNQPLEGVVPWMYVDQLNLVTTGMGNLIDPVSAAVNLPWTHGVNGPAASTSEIEAAFSTVKNSGMAGHGGGNQGDLTDLRLSQDAINALVAQKLSQFEGTLAQTFPYWMTLPADAQLGMLSMAWAMGPAFAAHFPSFTNAINTNDYNTAALQSWMRDASDWVPTSLDDDPSNHPANQNAGLRPRNLLNRQLFLNAGAQQAAGADPSELVWGSGIIASAGSALATAASGLSQGVVQAANHPILVGLGIAVGVGGALIVAQQMGLVRMVSPEADRKLVGIGRMLAKPFHAHGPGSFTQLDHWIHKATGKVIS